MINNRFVLYQVKREIKRNGREMSFLRSKINEYGEPTDEKEIVCTYKGLFHEHNPHMLDSYKIMTGQTLGWYTGEKYPQLMVTYEDFWFDKKITNEEGETEIVKDSVQVGDEVIWNGRLIRVTGISNVEEWNLLYDISFEEVEDGKATGKPEQ